LKVALVRTPDMFPIAKYLKEHEDPVFAKRRREAIFKTEGEVVQFPVLPISESSKVREETSTNATGAAATTDIAAS
jgi:hypothetical protein